MEDLMIEEWAVWLLGVLGAIVYLMIGMKIATWSYRTWCKPVKHWTKALAFPMHYAWASHERFKKLHPWAARCVTKTDKLVYLFVMMLIWPLKIAWNLAWLIILTIYVVIREIVKVIAKFCGYDDMHIQPPLVT
jgi:hypothetical protein